MKKDYFIGIVPPEDYLSRIEEFQSKWIERSGVEPHVTLKAQGGLSANREWIEKVEDVCANVRPFQVTLDHPAYFGESVLYLQVQSEELVELHHRLVEVISPSNDLIKQYFEGEEFIPHLTLGKEEYGGGISKGVSKQDLKEMEQQAEGNLTPYPSFEVDFIRIYELNVSERKYEKLQDLALGKDRSVNA
ncbi:2'-5' RNA ligase family protein [Guptibacillus algicola]|uniref:2'-5' RNA ligase family protein n=1 Tax=Guptibacillus algicola TaxID=225844 RepID=UPI001CD1DCB0|nr:2'-5' RNA ligase family protein [Alkalihalobacillus algicola]MCA0987439.1 2'-5' RNA ligase family protein [Alkalihalobacillus algicola]